MSNLAPIQRLRATFWGPDWPGGPFTNAQLFLNFTASGNRWTRPVAVLEAVGPGAEIICEVLVWKLLLNQNIQSTEQRLARTFLHRILQLVFF